MLRPLPSLPFSSLPTVGDLLTDFSAVCWKVEAPQDLGEAAAAACCKPEVRVTEHRIRNRIIFAQLCSATTGLGLVTLPV